MNKKKLKFALPKGSLQKSTFEIFNKAGIKVYLGSERSYYPSSDDSELEFMLIRPQEMPRYIQEGIFDAGLCGYDWILENNAKVEKVCELVYAKGGFTSVQWVIAVPENSKIRSIKDLKGKRISTELVKYVTQYFKKKKINCDVEFSWGATEVKAGVLCDAIVELTETGSSLKANKLRIVDRILASTTRLIANKDAFKNNWKKTKIENIAMLLKSAVLAQSMVGMKLNVKLDNLDKILKVLPSLREPTISNLKSKNWLALEVIIEEDRVKEILPELKRAGAEGIIEYPLNKIVY